MNFMSTFESILLYTIKVIICVNICNVNETRCLWLFVKLYLKLNVKALDCIVYVM